MSDDNCPALGSAEFSRTPKGEIRGALQAPQTASEPETTVSRVVRVPLERPDDAGWRVLVDLCREAAAFANGVMAGWWAEAHGWRPQEGQSTFKDFKGSLSGDVRVAVLAEAFAVWRRHKARIMRRDQRLPAFASDRALVVRGKYASGRGGVRFERVAAGQVQLRLLLVAQDAGEPTVLPVWMHAVDKDRYLGSLLDKIASGHYRCSKVTIQLDQRRRKLYALCAYDRPVPAARSGGVVATLGPLEADGSLLLRSARATRDFTRECYRIRTMKEHYEGVLKRFRRSVGRGPRWRQVYRRNMPASYTEWARGKMHQLSAEMIKWCVAQGVSGLSIAPLGDGDWPAHMLETMLKYKAQHVGIAIVEAGMENDSTTRAAQSVVRKEQKKSGQMRKAVRTIADAVL